MCCDIESLQSELCKHNGFSCNVVKCFRINCRLLVVVDYNYFFDDDPLQSINCIGDVGNCIADVGNCIADVSNCIGDE